MCHQCLIQVMPDRGSTCLDGGSYFFNYRQCVSCYKKANILITNRRQDEDEDGMEIIEYQHVCEKCGHIIASHEYTFQVNGNYQEYEMNCKLCGFGQDRVCVFPHDPEKSRSIF
ncbi:protein Churchill-like [Xenia sp. Carnegie-2017]|uniref:protein Churchill-like n=1 Tax=Xenia sp. Carnegie-2017 TaxID=2897299 RepID=UPI001F04A7BA|nr:protein Churchill-like [Xenia sp. Carnegie-2017]